MEQFEEFAADRPIIGITADDTPELLDAELRGHEEPSTESAYTDDPVRVYLREMGSVRLLSRQGEIELARRMERGKLRMRKALSRAPLVWQRVLAMHEGLCSANLHLDEFVELPGADNSAREKARRAAKQRIVRFARVHNELQELERKAASTPPTERQRAGQTREPDAADARSVFPRAPQDPIHAGSMGAIPDRRGTRRGGDRPPAARR